MDYYRITEEPLRAASSLENEGMYRMSVSMATLAIDLLLKSVLYRLDNTNDLLMGHDHIGMLRTIEKHYPKPEQPRKSLQERFKGYTGDYKPSEVDWGSPVGKEIW